MVAPWETLLTHVLTLVFIVSARVHRHVQLSEGAPAFPLFCSVGFERQVNFWRPCVRHREDHLSAFVSADDGRRPFRPSSLGANVAYVRDKSRPFEVLAGIIGCGATFN